MNSPHTFVHDQLLALRPAGADDAHIVRRLVELDDAAELDGPVLLALVDGRAVAALSLEDGRVVADPFVRTEDAVALLRLRATHVSSDGALSLGRRVFSRRTSLRSRPDTWPRSAYA